jgi:hypothetical protein
LQDLRKAEIIEAQVQELSEKLEQVKKVAAQLTSQVDRYNLAVCCLAGMGARVDFVIAAAWCFTRTWLSPAFHSILELSRNQAALP